MEYIDIQGFRMMLNNNELYVSIDSIIELADKLKNIMPPEIKNSISNLIELRLLLGNMIKNKDKINQDTLTQSIMSIMKNADKN